MSRTDSIGVMLARNLNARRGGPTTSATRSVSVTEESQETMHEPDALMRVVEQLQLSPVKPNAVNTNPLLVWSVIAVIAVIAIAILVRRLRR